MARRPAIRLEEAGADVAVLSRKPEEIEETAAKIKALGRRALPPPPTFRTTR